MKIMTESYLISIVLEGVGLVQLVLFDLKSGGEGINLLLDMQFLFLEFLKERQKLIRSVDLE